MTEDLFRAAGVAGEEIALPVGNVGATGYSWALDLPDGVETAGETETALLVRAGEPGVYFLTATLGRPWESEPEQTVQIELTVSPVLSGS